MITLRLRCPLCTDEMRLAGLSGDIVVTKAAGEAERSLAWRVYQFNWGPVPGHAMVCGKHRIHKTDGRKYVLGTCTASDPTMTPLYRFQAWEVD